MRSPRESGVALDDRRTSHTPTQSFVIHHDGGDVHTQLSSTTIAGNKVSYLNSETESGCVSPIKWDHGTLEADNVAAVSQPLSTPDYFGDHVQMAPTLPEGPLSVLTVGDHQRTIERGSQWVKRIRTTEDVAFITLEGMHKASHYAKWIKRHDMLVVRLRGPSVAAGLVTGWRSAFSPA